MKSFFYHIFLPLFAGGIIYLFIRPANFVIHNILEKAHFLFLPINTIREAALPLYSYLPSMLVYNLPDGLWVYSFTSAILFTWDFKLNNWSIPFCLTPVILGIGSEFGQLCEIVPGTFDILDVFFYALGFMLSIAILYNSKKDGEIKF